MADTSTNHNAWTLTKHVVHSINVTAGKVDEVIYGNKTNTVVQQPPKQPNSDLKQPSIFGFVFGSIVGIVILFV